MGNFYSITLDKNKLKNLDWVPESKHDSWGNINLSYNEINDVSGLFSNKKNNLKSL